MINQADEEYPEEVADEEEAPDFLRSMAELSPNAQLDDALILRLTYDLASRLHSPRAIAHRYGLLDEDQLRDYLIGHPEVVQEAQKLAAIFESDGAAEDRVRMKFLHATEHLIVPMAGLVADPKTPLGARIDGFKQIQRGAGMDGLSSTQRAAQQAGSGGQPFNLTITFTGGPPPITIQGTTGSGALSDEPRLPGPMSDVDADYDTTGPVDDDV
jgi:hypothetical protein